MISDDQIDEFPGIIHIGDMPITQGMIHVDGHFVHEERKTAFLILLDDLTDNKQIREYCYQHLKFKRDATPLLEREDENLTVDKVAAKYQEYFAEGLTRLISCKHS